MFPNKYAGTCNNPACNAKVHVGQGFIQKINGQWVVWCKQCVPARLQYPQLQVPKTPRLQVQSAQQDQASSFVQMQADESGRRVLTSDFKIILGRFEAENIPLIKSLPGARWDAVNKWWTVSSEMADWRRILEIADRIGLEVPPSLREIAVTKQAQAAHAAGLYPFQIEGVNFLAHKTRALLGDDMGLGKSVQSLMAVPEYGRCLVICRAGLKYNWLDEINKWRPDLKPVILSGKNSFRWPNRGEVVITNTEILPVMFHTIPKNKKERIESYWSRLKIWRDGLKAACPTAEDTTLILDEAHDYKNYDSQKSRKVKEIVRLVGKSIGLTGSPLTNRPEDLYGVFDVLGLAKETFGGGNTLDKFKALFNAEEKIVNSRGNRTTIYGKPQPIVPELLRRVMLRRTRNEVLPDLPNKTYTNLLVGDVDASLQRQLNELWEEWGSFIEIEDKLPPFEKFSEIRAKLARSRIPAMLEYIENAEEQDVPLVVFSAHLAPLDALLTRPGWAVISGDTLPEKRQQIVRAFQSGVLKGVAISIRAGGVGLTLTRAWKALFVDLAWVPGDNWQAEDRLCRIGQMSNKIEIVRMVSDHPLDLHVQNLLIDKIDTIRKAIDGMIAGNKVEVTGETEEEFQARMEKVFAAQEELAKHKNEMAEADRKIIAKSKVGKIHTREKARLKKVVLPLTEARIEAVRQSFRYMLSVCDGARQLDNVGFNKPDAAVAHWLLSAGLETNEEVEAGYYMLHRYHRQLGDKYPILFKD
jgi:SWI/SNF-related matrix-associated actin-dependent regulator of chromatin subfamily A-like protein 1